jgi:hypothetical protein
MSEVEELAGLVDGLRRDRHRGPYAGRNTQGQEKHRVDLILRGSCGECFGDSPWLWHGSDPEPKFRDPRQAPDLGRQAPAEDDDRAP